jgi:replication-associated recombination protein RarA
MIDSRDEMFLWVEKYRPQKIDDCVLPQALKDTFRQYVEQGELPNFLFAGTAGVGKTTIAKALCNEIGAEYLMINGSEESGIDTLRTKIKGFASTVSLTDAKKVVILDEADYLQANSTQPALRAFIEEFANNCRFILTCNFKNLFTVVVLWLSLRLIPKTSRRSLQPSSSEQYQFSNKSRLNLILKLLPN